MEVNKESNTIVNNVEYDSFEHPVQILYANADSNTFSINKEALHSVVIPKGIPVGVLSVVGAFRSGKSFLLDFFLRYLRTVQDKGGMIFTPSGEVPVWMGFGGSTLEGNGLDPESAKKGFSYRGGSERNTEGIWIWSEPFIVPNDAVEGGKICVLLMDTQGMFDGLTTQMLTTSIFGLTTLLSSYQIYNIEKRLQEDHLQHLALFSELYSRVVFHGDDSKRMSLRLSSRSLHTGLNLSVLNQGVSSVSRRSFNSNGMEGKSFLEAVQEKEEEMKLSRKQEAPFQCIDFLIRDWQNFTDENNLIECLKEVDEYKASFFAERKAEDLRETRRHIEECYQNIGVFMLPNPGKEVMKKNYDGSLMNVDPSFLSLLGFYIEHVLGNCLMPKLINKEVLYGEDFEAFAIAYGEMFSEVSIFPKALTILDATSEVNNHNAFRHALEMYKNTMESKVNEENGFVKETDFNQLNEFARMEAMSLFDKRATMGKRDSIEKHRQSLEEEIEEEMQRYKEENKARDPVGFVANYIVPLAICGIAFILKLLFSTVCGPWSETCRVTSDFFSSLMAFILISIIISNYKSFVKVFQYVDGIFQTLNKTSKKED